MPAKIVLGTASPIETEVSVETRDRESATIKVSGLYNVISQADPADFCPSGMTVESVLKSSSADGLGVMTIRCIIYESTQTFNALRTTFHVGMESVRYDLEDHPYLAGTPRSIILMWLATEESKRVDGETYKYQDKDGELQEISESKAIEFCDAYMAGITSFNRYFPVIRQVSTWKNPPGLNRNGRSFTGGSPQFSDEIGTYDSPPLTLNGYPNQNWFKSGDEWQENADKTWTRNEEWTYTPEGSGGEHAWIYTELYQ